MTTKVYKCKTFYYLQTFSLVYLCFDIQYFEPQCFEPQCFEPQMAEANTLMHEGEIEKKDERMIIIKGGYSC